VKIDLARKPRMMTRCTCSICRRHAALWIYCTRKTARIICAPEATAAYLWGDRQIAFCHCRTCGCLTHYESVSKDPGSRIAVNGNMLPPSDTDGVRVRTFDGAATWKYLDEDVC